MLLRFPSLALGFVPVLARRLGVFVVATVNRKFWPKLKSGLGAFPPAQHSPFAASGRGFKHFAWPPLSRQTLLTLRSTRPP